MKFISILMILTSLSWLNAEDASNRHRPIRVEFDIIELPHDSLRKLTSGKTKTSLHTSVQRLVLEKKAKRINTSLCRVNSGKKCIVESVREFIFPTEYQPPSLSGKTEHESSSFRGNLTPTAFETRNLGEMITVTATIKKNGTTIKVEPEYEVTTLVKILTLFSHTDQWGQADIIMPEFASTIINHSVNLENGKAILYSAYTPLDKNGKPDTERKVLVFIKATIIVL